MSSIRLYRTDPYQISCNTRITAIGEKDGFACFSCDASVFFPEGGGQPSDIGTVCKASSVFNIIAADDDGLDQDVWHMSDAPIGTFSIGDEILLTIDWDWRFKNMQRHCGEHMLSGTMHALFGGVNKGFHMGEEYITIDIDLEGRMLSDEEIDLAERTVNDAIWADLPVSVTYFENYEASLSMPVRKQVPHDGEVSVVTVGELPSPYDCIACCGTHPSSSGQVGLVAIYKHEPNKGMNRIYFDCGIMAKEKLTSDMKLLGELSKRNSCNPSDLLHKAEVAEENLSALKQQLANMASYIKESEKTVIIDLINDSEGSLVYSLDMLSIDDLLKLGFSVISETENKLLILLHPSSITALLFSSGERKCGALVKEKAPDFGGKGGGRDDNARAVFNSLKEMEKFAEAIK